MTDKPLTKQQQQQRDAWEQARRVEPREPLTEEEEKRNEYLEALHSKQVGEVISLLNHKGDDLVTELVIETPEGPKAFNIAAIHEALHLQTWTWRSVTSRHNGIPAKLEPFHTLFPGLEIDRKDEKVIMFHYKTNIKEGQTTLTITWSKMDENGDTLEQPRYNETFTSTVSLDNRQWRMVVNGFTEGFPQGAYVHLYSHDFEYIWDYEGNCQRIIPEGATNV